MQDIKTIGDALDIDTNSTTGIHKLKCLLEAYETRTRPFLRSIMLANPDMHMGLLQFFSFASGANCAEHVVKEASKAVHHASILVNLLETLKQTVPELEHYDFHTHPSVVAIKDICQEAEELKEMDSVKAELNEEERTSES